MRGGAKDVETLEPPGHHTHFNYYTCIATGTMKHVRLCATLYAALQLLQHQHTSEAQRAI